MKNSVKRHLSWLLVLAVCISLLSGLSVDVSAASYVANWGIREVIATELSSAAKAFYTGSNTYEDFMQLRGSSTTSEVPQSQLYDTLQEFMTDKQHKETTYGETRYLYQYTDCQNGDLSSISSFYSGISIGPEWDDGDTWNREHTWPNSKGNASGNGENDIMMLRPTAKSENGSRGNTAYGESTGYYDPNMVSGGKYNLHGDVARIMLYVYVRWGNTVSMWGSSGVMESKEVLLKWIEEDPVDTWELGRNDSVQSITGTRNVFVDYPELAFQLFGEEVPADMPTPSRGIPNGTVSATVTLMEDGVDNGNAIDTYADTYIILPEPNQQTIGDYAFVGWVENTVSSTTEKPAFYAANSRYSVPEGGATLHALYTTFESDTGNDSNTYTLTDTFYDGDKIIIVNGTNALSHQIIKTYYKGHVPVSPSGSTLTAQESTIVWSVTKDGSGFHLSNTAGQKLSIEGNYDSIPYDQEHDSWTLQSAKTSGSVYVVNENGKRLCWTSYSNFSAYSTSSSECTESASAMKVYRKTGTDYYTTSTVSQCQHTGGIATCTQQAICELCGQPYGLFERHRLDLEIIREEALRQEQTCTQAASYYYSCECGAIGEEYFTVGEAKGHGLTDLRNFWKATCTEPGYSGDTCCTDCEEILEQGYVLPILEHQYENNFCILCGQADPNSYDLADCGMEIVSSVIYTGKPAIPSVVLYNASGDILAEGRDYVLTCENNNGIGEATVTITGIGDYYGTVTDTFDVELGTVAGLTVEPVSGTSVEITFNPIPGAEEYWIYRSGKRRVKITETSYTMTGLSAGSSYSFYVKAAAKVDGKDVTGDSSETVYATPRYTMEGYTLTVNDESLTYTGKARTPSVTVRSVSGTKLTKNKDYKVTCENNTEVGTAMVIITGMGKYSGTLIGSFDIIPARPNAPDVSCIDGVSAEVKISTAKGAQWYDVYVDGVLWGRTEETVFIAQGLKNGVSQKFTVVAGATVDGRDYVSSASKYDSCTPRHEMASCQVVLSQEEFVYTGKYLRPEVTVYGYQSEVLESGVDYTASFKNNKSTGKAYVQITGKGGYTGTVKAYYVINPVQVQNVKISSTTATSVKISYSKSSSIKYYNIYVDGAYVGRTTSGSYTIKNLTAGEDHEVYVIGTKTVSKVEYAGQASEPIIIRAGTYIGNYKVTMEYSSVTYTGSAMTPGVTVKTSSKGSTLTEGVDYTVSYSNNTQIGKATVTITGIGKYAGTITKTFTIKPQEVAGLNVEATGRRSIQVSFQAVEGATEYWIYVNGSRKAKITGTEYTVSGLSPNKTYKVTVKAVTEVDGTDYASDSCDTVSAKTWK